MKSEDIYVTTDNDYFNSADEAKFFLKKGEVKKLPEKLTSIIEVALEGEVIREATDEEIKEALKEQKQ